MYTEVFRNTDVYGTSWRPRVRLGCQTLVGAAVILGVSANLGLHVLEQWGILQPPPGITPSAKPSQIWMAVFFAL